jgi:Fe-S cluster biogenesis protein NfuA
MQEKIQSVLDLVRPSLQMDGGDVEFVSYDEKSQVVKVRLTGHCAHCPMSNITLKQGIEAEIIKQLPEIKAVEAV